MQNKIHQDDNFNSNLRVLSKEENQNDKVIDLELSNKNTKRTHFKNSSDSQFNKLDQKHNVINSFREETISDCRPPQGSLSELVFLNKIKEIKLALSQEDFLSNNRDGSGTSCSWTPLYWAVKLRKYDIVELLLENGANINIVVNDCEECCGTVLDLATLRGDDEIEVLLRAYAEKEEVEFGQSFKPVRTKLRGKAPAFNFRYYSKKKIEEAA